MEYGPDSKEMRSIRGQDISMIFQEPMASLAPVYTIGAQMMEAVMVHQKKKDKKAAKELCMEMLREVGMPDPEQKFKSFPFYVVFPDKFFPQKLVLVQAYLINFYSFVLKKL